jgi:hypothetical protein
MLKSGAEAWSHQVISGHPVLLPRHEEDVLNRRRAEPTTLGDLNKMRFEKVMDLLNFLFLLGRGAASGMG